MKKKKDALTKETKESVSQKRPYINQSKIPLLSLSETIRLAQSLYDDFAGKPTAPHQLAISVAISPTSSNWRDLCGASIAYGLTEGGCNAKTISLTELGKRIVAPTSEGDDSIAKVQASLLPEVANKFFKQYDKAKFPQEKIARNVLAEMGVPNDRLDNVLGILKQNGEFTGTILQTKTGPFVAIDTTIFQIASSEASEPEEQPEPPKIEKILKEVKPPSPVDVYPVKQRVFITHGKNKEIVSQLKDLLAFGKFVPVVAEEHEIT